MRRSSGPIASPIARWATATADRRPYSRKIALATVALPTETIGHVVMICIQLVKLHSASDSCDGRRRLYTLLPRPSATTFSFGLTHEETEAAHTAVVPTKAREVGCQTAVGYRRPGGLADTLQTSRTSCFLPASDILNRACTSLLSTGTHAASELARRQLPVNRPADRSSPSPSPPAARWSAPSAAGKTSFMPIKLPKGFQRRKSSGNALDEVNGASTAPPGSSFRVIERPALNKSYDGNLAIRSGGGGGGGSASASASAGFLPSLPRAGSFDHDEDDLFSVARPDAGDRQQPSGASSSRPSTSTNPSSIDSYSDRHAQHRLNDVPAPPPPSARAGFLRTSAHTFSLTMGLRPAKDAHHAAAAAAEPGAERALPPAADSRRSRAMTVSSASTATPPKLFDSEIGLDSVELDSFGNMFDGIGAHSSREQSPAGGRPQNGRASSPQRSNYPPSSFPAAANLQPAAQSPSLRPITASRRRVSAEEEDDARPRPPPVPKHANTSDGHHHRPPQAESPVHGGGRDDYLDPGLAASAELWARFDPAQPSAARAKGPNKVMTPAQFERYKQQQEIDRRVGALQRRKQEAHLAVYRQQMMKVTGEHAELQPRSASSSTNLLRASSTPELGNRLSNVTASTKQSSRSSGGEEDEDEDVPLGILAAHGFPSKTRPPTQLSHASSNPNLRTLAHTQGGAAGSSPGPDAASKRGSLPVFARNLPQDPYFGASIVHAANREPLAMHAPNHASLYDLPPSMQMQMQNPLLGGARGSALAPMMPPQMVGMPPQMAGMPPQMAGMPPMPPMPPMLSPGDHAQIQMNQHMTQMMQMQLQWMQQMTNMMGSQMSHGPGGGGPAPGQPPRPQSAMPHLAAPLGQQRAMSTLTPSMANWNLASTATATNYAPSIAPSERSNVGLASRYRPVSTIQDAQPASRRASTFTSATFRPWSTVDSTSRPLSHVNKPSVNTVGRKSPLAQIDDDDDEQAWAEMKAKKETKQKTWKLRKGNNVLQELYNGV
ncbi:hypothetical protein DV737_g2251, partial [Chaetothyriales sp. CBS 132003]